MPSKVRTEVPETFADWRRVLINEFRDKTEISLGRFWEIFNLLELMVEKTVKDVKFEMRNYRLTELSAARKEAREYKRLYETATLLHEAEKYELEEKALRDDYTGLYRKKHFLEVVLPNFVKKIAADRRIHIDRRGGAALWFVDLNKLKAVNDDRLLGHKIGDELISWIAELLNRHVRKEDVAGRVGGDEFLVLQSIVHRQVEVWDVASRIKQQYDLHKWSEIDARLGQHRPSVAIGVALLHLDSVQGHASSVSAIMDAWIKKAEAAMYVNKRSGAIQIHMIGVEWDNESGQMVEFDINKKGEWISQIQTAEFYEVEKPQE